MPSIRSLILLAAAVLCFVCTPCGAFGVVVPPNVRTEDSMTGLHLFGNAFKDAFSNDDSLGEKENAGLKGGPKINEVTINGKPVKAVANQKVSQVLAAARTKVTYSCKKGDCGTCEIQMDGRIVKACQAKIPKGKCTINTF
mmetsp:Transcript_26887/g.35078  ORF Transcript_26887/g.35078 Transcript_26887/m.35078 type:complete len:141 (+) Transcript_26887:99-521(+)